MGKGKKMAEFKIIETQEQFDAAITERIARAKEAARKEFEGYLSPEQQKKAAEELEKKVRELTGKLTESEEKYTKSQSELAEQAKKIAKYETDSAKTRIAHELELSYDAVAYLRGANEEEIRKSAEGLKTIIGNRSVPPLADPEGDAGKDGTKAAYKKMLKDMKGE